jgi:F-type H+-transporting ATPase subunit delta
MIKEISTVVERFVEVLKKDGQLKNSAKIIEKFSEIYNDKHGIVEAQIITRKKIEDSEKNKIEKFIKEKYSAKEVMMKNIVDESIKGGIIIKVGDEVIDASVEGQLKRLKRELVK